MIGEHFEAIKYEQMANWTLMNWIQCLSLYKGVLCFDCWNMKLGMAEWLPLWTCNIEVYFADNNVLLHWYGFNGMVQQIEIVVAEICMLSLCTLSEWNCSTLLVLFWVRFALELWVHFALEILAELWKCDKSATIL